MLSAGERNGSKDCIALKILMEGWLIKAVVDGKEVKVSRIESLKSDEMSYLKISNFKQDGVDANIKTVGTILIVDLAKPILPNTKTTFFDGQIPVQIRSGETIL
jgi:hypothetical protein